MILNRGMHQEMEKPLMDTYYMKDEYGEVEDYDTSPPLEETFSLMRKVLTEIFKNKPIFDKSDEAQIKETLSHIGYKSKYTLDELRKISVNDDLFKAVLLNHDIPHSLMKMFLNTDTQKTPVYNVETMKEVSSKPWKV